MLPGWLADNLNRSYPFQAETTDKPPSGPLTLLNLPDPTIVDFGCLMSLDSGFDAELHAVKLTEIARTGSTLQFKFESTAPALAPFPLIFSRAIPSPEFVSEDVDSVAAHNYLDSFGSGTSEHDCPDESPWSGFLVTGNLEQLLVLLPSDGTITGDPPPVEPAVIGSMVRGYARSINLANDDRTRTENADDCDPVIWPFALSPTYVQATCLQGSVRFQAGYNGIVRQDDSANTLVISAAAGAGLGQPCGEPPIFQGEAPPSGSRYLSGGAGCNDVIRSINGVGGQLLNLLSGQGVQIIPVPAQNAVIIDINMTGLAVCFSSASHPAF